MRKKTSNIERNNFFLFFLFLSILLVLKNDQAGIWTQKLQCKRLFSCLTELHSGNKVSNYFPISTLRLLETILIDTRNRN